VIGDPARPRGVTARDAAAQAWIRGGTLTAVQAILRGERLPGPPVDMARGAREILSSIAAGRPTAHARLLLDELAAAAPDAPELYRGTVMGATAASRRFAIGATVALPLGSWSTNPRVAQGFADASPTGLEWRAQVRGERIPACPVGVWMQLQPGARAIRLVDLLDVGWYRRALERGLDVDPLNPRRPFRDPDCREYLLGGSFVVVDAARERNEPRPEVLKLLLRHATMPP
jgi:hypothetical protein